MALCLSLKILSTREKQMNLAKHLYGHTIDCSAANCHPISILKDFFSKHLICMHVIAWCDRWGLPNRVGEVFYLGWGLSPIQGVCEQGMMSESVLFLPASNAPLTQTLGQWPCHAHCTSAVLQTCCCGESNAPTFSVDRSRKKAIAHESVEAQQTLFKWANSQETDTTSPHGSYARGIRAASIFLERRMTSHWWHVCNEPKSCITL